MIDTIDQWTQTLDVLLDKPQLYQSDFFQLGFVYFKLNRYDNCYLTFKKIDWEDYRDCAWLRRTIIAPLMQAKQFQHAAKLLKLILEKHPESTPDLSTLCSVLIRLNAGSEACVYLEKILLVEPENYDAVAQLIQAKIPQLEEAVALTKRYAHAFKSHERLLKIGIIVLAKAQAFDFCLDCIRPLDFTHYALDVGIKAAQIAFRGNDFILAKSIIVSLQQAGHHDAKMWLILAKLQVDTTEALDMLHKAYVLSPNSIPVNNLLAEILLKKGCYTEALNHLSTLKDLLPNNPHTRIQNAKALKFTHQFDLAADEMLAVVALLPDEMKWKRYAASSLAQAGRHQEAKAMFEAGIAHRNTLLPATFAGGLEQLGDKVCHVQLPQKRLDWLAQIVNNTIPRDLYEKTAKWINLLDQFLIDWLECRPNQADEAMAFFEDLNDIYTLLHQQLAGGKGVILAGAHVGPLFSIPLALDLLGLPHQWLASTPSISSLAYNDTLISTSENTESEVVRRIMKALQQGKIIGLAVDGAMNPAAPRIGFESQHITYSDFAAKMSFRHHTPSFFIVSCWENNQFCLKLQALPLPLTDESLDVFCERWTADYLKNLKAFLMNHPENARLSGGIWRDIK